MESNTSLFIHFMTHTFPIIFRAQAMLLNDYIFKKPMISVAERLDLCNYWQMRCNELIQIAQGPHTASMEFRQDSFCNK